jgi:hypothetical protein
MNRTAQNLPILEPLMTKPKSLQEERAIILGQPSKRPYGARVRIHVQTSRAVGNAEQVCVSLPTGAFLSIEPTHTAPWEGGKKFIVTLEGFPTAASAEAAGRRLVQALLWTAISTDSPLRLEYLTYEPASVFERNRSTGDTCEGYGEVGYSATVVLGELHDAYALLPEPDEKLLLSMEIFCAARLESSQRAVFLALVSALEPLASEAPLGNEVAAFVADCIASLRATSGLPSDLKTSLESRLANLRHESIGQALRRLAREKLPSQPDAAQAIDSAYALRSQIIHSGVPADLDVDLERESREISTIIRAMYASILKRQVVCGG